MKYTVSLFIFVVGMAFLQGPHDARAEQGTVIKISSDPWEPWIIGAEGHPPTGGMGVDLAKEVFRRVGVPIDITIYPYARCLNQMKTGERDILLLAKKTAERETFMVYSDVAVEEKQLLFYATEHRPIFSWQDWPDLKGLIVGGVRGFNYGDLETNASINGFKVEHVGTELQSLRKLLAGHVDVAAFNASTVNFFLAQHPEWRGKIKSAKKSLTQAKFYFALSKKGKALGHLDAINGALRDMKSDGGLKKILNHGED